MHAWFSVIFCLEIVVRGSFHGLRFRADGLTFTDQDIEFVEDLIDPDKKKLREAHSAKTIDGRSRLAGCQRA